MNMVTKFLILLAVVLLPSNLRAIDYSQYCKSYIDLADPMVKFTSIQTSVQDYAKEENWKSELKSYLLCFTGEFSGKMSGGLTITAQADAPLIIYELKINSSASPTPVLVTLSGSNITISNVILTGNGTGTAIQVNGTGMTIGPKVGLSSFEKGIYIAKDASALITQDKFTNVTTPIVYEVPSPPVGEGVISTDWLGKHVSEADATKVDRIAGKLDLTECKGSVEMYLKKFLSS